jgi:molecular chaperone DnaJ
LSRDYYEVLGVGKDAGPDEIRHAFRQLAKKYHPDANPGDPNAEARFKEINEAYDVLSDPVKKSNYDAYGNPNGPVAGPGSGGAGGDNPFERVFGDFDGFPFGNLFGNFDELLGGGRRRSTGPRRGSDLEMELDISLEEAFSGTEKDVRIPRIESCQRCNGTGAEPGSRVTTCSTCNGTGQVRHARSTILGQMMTVTTCPKCGGTGKTVEKPCRECGGSGQVQRTRVVTVKIPAGAESGLRLRLAGQGNAGTQGGPTGDLYVVVFVKPHAIFQRQADDLILDKVISFPLAAVGGITRIPTLEGDIDLDVPAGTQPGAVLRVRNKGMPRLRQKGRGDLLVRVNVRVPTKVSAKDREILRELGKLDGETFSEQRSLFQRLKGIGQANDS